MRQNWTGTLPGWHCPRTPGLCLVMDTRKCGNCARKLPSFTSAIRPKWSPTKVSLSFYFSLFPHPFLTKIFCQNHYIFHYNSLTAPLHILQMGRRSRRRSPCTTPRRTTRGWSSPRCLAPSECSGPILSLDPDPQKSSGVPHARHLLLRSQSAPSHLRCRSILDPAPCRPFRKRLKTTTDMSSSSDIFLIGGDGSRTEKH